MSITGKKIGVALSGGGYRAAAYHIGTLRALHHLGLLDKVDVLSSVSGGSITAAYYALHKDDYEDFERSFIKGLSRGVLWSSFLYLGGVGLVLLALSVALGYLAAFLAGIFFPNLPILTGICAALGGVVTLFALLILLLKHSFVTLPTSKLIARQYDQVFFMGKTLGELPKRPALCINSTNIATQVPFFFSKKDMGEYAYRVQGKSIFEAQHFPISRAVMASSCVPYGFTPITIDKKYLREQYGNCPTKPEPPKLIDGGVYDNQGAHKLSHDRSRFHADYIIVSDAGNSGVSAAKTTNFFNLAMTTISLMMNRVKRMQRSDNLYEPHQGTEYFAYVPLEWDCCPKLLLGFVTNLKDGHLPPDVWQAHGITEEEIAQLRTKGPVGAAASERIIEQLKRSIGWASLEPKAPQQSCEELARRVGTSLVALSHDEIESLAGHSAWLTELQLRLYMPMLLTQSAAQP